VFRGRVGCWPGGDMDAAVSLLRGELDSALVFARSCGQSCEQLYVRGADEFGVPLGQGVERAVDEVVPACSVRSGFVAARLQCG
ncbi:hypothetical protein ACC691_38375, partial [Rhizobium johnstonii]|uniref:hypothetical protein n=1 Tax=Rhizobium johnstonii TaxID=3019933 RepID=UPI003F9E1BB0